MLNIQHPTFNIQHSAQKGSLLLELLIVISLLAVILAVGSEAVFVSLQSNKVSGERDVATALANEALEAVRGTAEEKWQNIYTLTKATQHYFATSTVSAGKWTLATTTVATDEQVTVNGVVYTRYVIVENVSRDAATRAIETTYVSDRDDPSTQKITVTASWTGGDPISISDYFFRWKNKACNQTDWSGSAVVNGVAVCATGTTYDSISPAGYINTAGGTLKLQ